MKRLLEIRLCNQCPFFGEKLSYRNWHDPIPWACFHKDTHGKLIFDSPRYYLWEIQIPDWCPLPLVKKEIDGQNS